MPLTDEERLAYLDKLRSQEKPDEQSEQLATKTDEDRLKLLASFRQPEVTQPQDPLAYDPNLPDYENQANEVMSRQVLGFSAPTVSGGVLSSGARAISAAYRVGELLPENWGGKRSREQADWFANYSGALIKAAEKAGNQGVVKRGATSALSNTVQLLAGAPAGVPAMIGIGVADQMNLATTEGREQGLKGAELGAYAGRQGLIEGVTTGLMQKYGLGGMEKVLPGAFAAARNGVRQGINQTLKAGLRGAAKETARTFGEEEIEEITIGALQMWNDKYSGVDKSNWSLDQVARTFVDTTSAVAWMTAGGAGPVHLARELGQRTPSAVREDITAANAEKEAVIKTEKKEADWDVKTAELEKRERNLYDEFYSSPVTALEWVHNNAEKANKLVSGHTYTVAAFQKADPSLPAYDNAAKRKEWFTFVHDAAKMSPDQRQAVLDGMYETGEWKALPKDSGPVPVAFETVSTPYGDFYRLRKSTKPPAATKESEKLAGKAAQIEHDIVTTAQEGKTPTRKQWKEWGLNPELGKDAKARAAGVQQLAAAVLKHNSEPNYVPIQEEQQQPGAEKFRTLATPEQAAQQPVAEETQQEVPQEAPVEQEAASQEVVGELPVEPELVQAPTEVVDEGLEQAVQPETWKEPGPPSPKGEVAQFIESTAGRLGISADALTKPVGFVKHAAKRFFTSAGDLPQTVYNEKVRRDGKISKIQRSMAYNLKDYKRALREAYPGRIPSKEETRAFGMALRGEVPPEALPAPIRKQIGLMRSNIDALSHRAIEVGAIEGPLVGTVLENEGMYVYRGYRVHTDAKWAEKVPVEIRNAAKAWIRNEYPGKSEAEVDGLIEHLLYEGKAADTPMASLASKLGKKDIDVLKKRKAIPRELRALWGEENDPVLIYAQTVTRLGNLIENHKFLEQVKQDGLGTFFSESPVINNYGELKVRIAADESSAMNPLNGLYTTPEIRDAFIRATEAKHNPAWVQYALAANAAVKISKTIGSAMTHIRNVVGNVGFAVANGHWRVGSAPGSFKAVMANLTSKPDAEYRSYFLRAVELGVVAQDVHASEFRSYIQDASMKDLDEFAFDAEKRRAYKTKAGLKQAAATIADVYQAEDDVWKLYAWENEKTRYSKAFPEWTKEQVEEHAARIVTDTYPTYSKVPEGIKALRRFPILGTFVSFPAEVVRTTYHTATLAKQELADPRTRNIGAERAVGLAVSLTAASAISTASRFLVGVSSDDDKDNRWFVPPWQKNSAFLYLSKKANGVIQYVDLAYTDPHNYLLTPVRALFSGKDLKDGLWDSFADFMEPYAGEEILATKVLDIARNTKKTGGQVYNPQDSINQQAGDVVAHLWTAFEPGTVTSLKRITAGFRGVTAPSGRKFNPAIETVALLSGQRIQEVDIAESLKFRARDYSKQWREAQSIWLGTITNRGSVSDGEIRSAYERAERARQGLFRDMSEATQAAIRQGVDSADAIHSLDLGGISDDVISDLLSGSYFKTQLAKRHIDAIYRANPKEAERRLQIINEIISSQESQIVPMGDSEQR